MAFNQATADLICAKLADGWSLRRACREVENAPDPSTILNWLAANENFSQQYARARDIGYKLLADELIEIADTPLMGVIETVKENFTEIKRADMIEHRRLQVDTRKWMLAKMLPKVYGDKVELSGSVETTSDDPDVLVRKVAFMLTSAGIKQAKEEAEKAIQKAAS